jgi:hypothetical protein
MTKSSCKSKISLLQTLPFRATAGYWFSVHTLWFIISAILFCSLSFSLCRTCTFRRPWRPSILVFYCGKLYLPSSKFGRHFRQLSNIYILCPSVLSLSLSFARHLFLSFSLFYATLTPQTKYSPRADRRIYNHLFYRPLWRMAHQQQWQGGIPRVEI